MPALFKVGEAVGPGIIISDDYTEYPDGRTLECVTTSWGQKMRIQDRLEDCSYHTVAGRPFGSYVLVPYTVRHPATESGLPKLAHWVDVSGSRYDYWRVLCDWWKGADLAIIEHDVRARPDIFDTFENCPEPWCYFRYSNHTPENASAWHYGNMGCVRFRSSVISAAPTAVTTLEERWRDWHHMSTGLGIALRHAGFEPHMHEPPVDHHRMMDIGGVAKAMTT